MSPVLKAKRRALPETESGSRDLSMSNAALAQIMKPPRREPLSTQVEASIRDALTSGRFMPGERLNIRGLAATLGTSATPVREALSRLAAEGAIEVVPGQSVRIPRFSPDLYRELIAIRLVLEGLAVERAAAAIDAVEIAELDSLLKQYLRAARANKREETLASSKQFRFAVYRAADMPELVRMIEGLWTRTAPPLRLIYQEQAADPALEVAYIDLLAALKAKDRIKARKAIERAITIGLERLTHAE